MPHAVIEYSANIAEQAQSAGVCKAVHAALADSGLFRLDDIKIRAYPAHEFMIGSKAEQGSFLHVTVSMIEGRTTEQKQKLSQNVMDSLAAVKNVDSKTVDVREIAKDTYRKIGAQNG